MDVVLRPWAGAPERWIIVFDRRAATWWMNQIPIGKYKHVRAFGYVAAAKAWVFFDDALDRMSVKIACDADAKRLMLDWLREADAIGMPVHNRVSTVPRIGIGCVRSIKHLIGLPSGALRPDGLWRDCLAHGGEIVAHEATRLTASSDRPEPEAGAAAGAG